MKLTDKFINKIICGDNINVLKQFPDNCIDLTVTSPPYNMRTRIRNGKYTEREKSEHFSKKYKYFKDSFSIDEYYKIHKNILLELLRVSKTIIWNVAIVTGSKEAIFKLIGFFCKNIKDVIIWDKGNGQPAMHDNCINRVTELVLILENDAAAGRVLNRAYFKRGEFDDILRIKREKSETKINSAIFPEKFAAVCIKNFSKKNDIILDPFSGTGTTPKMAAKLKRRYVAIDISQEYCDIAIARVKKETDQRLLF